MSTNSSIASKSTALSVAKYFLNRAIEHKINDYTQMKVLKLTYIAHGWFLAIFNKPLFSEEIQAWQYGPVIPVVYQRIRRFGKAPIKTLEPFYEVPDIQDVEVQQFLEEVALKYGKLSGLQLSTLTHQKGTPWDEVAHQWWNRSNVISDDLIKRHYQELLNDA